GSHQSFKKAETDFCFGFFTWRNRSSRPILEYRLCVARQFTNSSLMWPENSDWLMTALFLLALASLGFTMKLVALLLPANRQIDRRGISWVLVSPDSVLRAQPATAIQPVVLRLVMLLGAVSLTYWIYWQLVRGFQMHGILLSYLATPILLLMSEMLVALVTLILLPSGLLFPALHRRPWAARSIADFWGHRWNLW